MLYNIFYVWMKHTTHSKIQKSPSSVMWSVTQSDYKMHYINAWLFVHVTLSMSLIATCILLCSVLGPPQENMANPKEKTPMCLVNELARFNRIQPQYKLLNERGPAHAKVRNRVEKTVIVLHLTFYKSVMGSQQQIFSYCQSWMIMFMSCWGSAYFWHFLLWWHFSFFLFSTSHKWTQLMQNTAPTMCVPDWLLVQM